MIDKINIYLHEYSSQTIYMRPTGMERKSF